MMPSTDNPEETIASGNLPGCEDVSGWFFKDGDFFAVRSSGEDEKKARFTILDKDTIEIFVYSTENTYTLHRE